MTRPMSSSSSKATALFLCAALLLPLVLPTAGLAETTHAGVRVGPYARLCPGRPVLRASGPGPPDDADSVNLLSGTRPSTPQRFLSSPRPQRGLHQAELTAPLRSRLPVAWHSRQRLSWCAEGNR